MSVVGTSLHKLDGNPYYSPSFPRGGLAGTFCADVTHYLGLTDFTITIEHRDETDTSFATLVVLNAFTSATNAQVDISGIKQIVRFKYELNGGAATDGDGVHFVMQAPSWRPYA